MSVQFVGSNAGGALEVVTPQGSSVWDFFLDGRKALMFRSNRRSSSSANRFVPRRAVADPTLFEHYPSDGLVEGRGTTPPDDWDDGAFLRPIVDSLGG